MLDDSKFLIIVLSEKISLTFCNPPLPAKLVALGETFMEKTSGHGCAGHYDWLRSADNVLLGVRYWPFFDDAHDRKAIEALFDKMNELEYVRKDPGGKFLEIRFRRDYPVSDLNSCDQDLGDNAIFLSPSGRFAICFELAALGEAELNSLRSANLQIVDT